MGIASENGTKSTPNDVPRLILAILTSGFRDLAEAFDHIHALKVEQKKLVAALRSVTGTPDFRPEQHSDVLDLLTKVTITGILWDGLFLSHCPVHVTRSVGKRPRYELAIAQHRRFIQACRERGTVSCARFRKRC